MQTDSKFSMFFFLLICILIRKELKRGGGVRGEFNYIYKLFNVFIASNPLVALTKYRFFK